jgi:hypothetical protein
MLNLRGCPLSQMNETLLELVDLKIDLFLKFTTNTLHKILCFPNPSNMKSNTKLTPMRTMDESFSCLDRVDIAPPKLNLQWKGFSQNPNENDSYKRTPIRYQIIILRGRVTLLFMLSLDLLYLSPF